MNIQNIMRFTFLGALTLSIITPHQARANTVWDATKKPGTTQVLTSEYTGPTNVNFVGDVNGDGFDDMIVTSAKNDDSEATVYNYLVYGSSTKITDGKLASTASAVFTNSRPLNGVSRPVGGDLNNDGFSDIVIGDDEYTYIIFGKATQFSGTTKTKTAANASILDASASRAEIADMNNDGIVDLAIPGAYRSTVVFGSAALTSATIDSLYHQITQSIFLGDVNNDGFMDWADIVEKGNTAATVEIYTGSTSFYTNNSAAKAATKIAITPSTAGVATANAISVSAFPLSDLNRDSYDDTLIRVTHYFAKGTDLKELKTTAHVLYNDGTTPKTRTLGSLTELDSDFLRGLYNAGDVNGDLVADSASLNLPNSAQQSGSTIMNAFTSAVGVNEKTAADMLQLGFTPGNRIGAYQTATDIASTPNTAGDLNNDGFSDLLFSGDPDHKAATFIVYGQSSFSGSESRIQNATGLTKDRVQLTREDGSILKKRVFSTGKTGKSPSANPLKYRNFALVVSSNGKQVATIKDTGAISKVKKLAPKAQSSVVEMESFNISGTATEEAVVVTRSGNDVTTFYLTVKNGVIKTIDSKTLSTTETSIELVVDPAKKTVAIQKIDSSAIKTYKIVGTTLQ